MSIKFTPTSSGQWGVRMFEEGLGIPGQAVSVVKANGETKTVTLGTLLSEPDARTQVWSIVEAKPDHGRTPRAYGRGRASTVVRAVAAAYASADGVRMMGPAPAPVAPAESDEALVQRLLIDGPAYQFQGDLRAAVSS